MKLPEEFKNSTYKLIANVYKVDKSDKELKTIKASVKKLDIFSGVEEFKNNNSLLYFQADLGNAMLVNRNGHGMAKEDVVRVYKKWEHTFVNLDHLRSDIRGFIVKSVLTDAETKQILKDEEALAYEKPFNVSVGFIIWESVDPALTALLNQVSTSPSEEINSLISLSLELSYNEFYIYEGESKNMFEGRIIQDDQTLEKMYKWLKDFDGSGYNEDGKPIYLVATGEDLTPLGCGLVTNPAAYVEGITTGSKEMTASVDENDPENNDEPDDEDDMDDNDHPEGCDCEDCKESGEKDDDELDASINNNHSIDVVEKLNYFEQLAKDLQSELNDIKEKQKISSQEKNLNVKPISMKITSLKDITDENLKEIKASEISTFIADELAKGSEAALKDIQAKEDEITSYKTQIAELNTKATDLEAKFNTVVAELDTFKSTAAAKEVEDNFQLRMNALSEEYNLDDKDTEVIASQIRAFDEDAYVAWKKSFDVIASAKKKTCESKKEKEDMNSAVDPIAELKAKDAATPPSTASFNEDVFEKYKNAFSTEKSVTISI